MSTLLIDNHDSNTFNLFQLIARVEGREPEVVRNDEASWEELEPQRLSRVVISAGPGRPDRPRDFGLSAAAIEQAELPLLGVCLGHQGLVLAAGGTVGAAPRPVHGGRSRIHHCASELFAGLPQGFMAVRYHSLAALEPLPAALEVTARTAEGIVMAVRHRERPHWGVQFHPESVLSEFGEELMRNFVALAERRRSVAAPRPPRRRPRRRGPQRRLELHVETVARAVDSESAFVGLFGAAPEAFWLDSSLQAPGIGRFSYMGGPGSALLRHDVGNAGAPLLERLERELSGIEVAHELPFPFCGGFVGYLGYELKAECGSPNRHVSPLPDAALLFVDRLVVYDHEREEAHAVCLAPAGEHREARDWTRATAAALRRLTAAPPPAGASGAPPSVFRLAQPAPAYLRDIEACQEHLRAGESYEICLTNRLEGPPCPDVLRLHRVLRRINPAPFAAYLRLGGVELSSSSPERFLSLDRERRLEARPIKGTLPRGATPAEDREAAARLRDGAKDRAENLMIVDVLRNDLGRVAEIGSVSVPRLMGVESYATVHQLVSTVSARLRADATLADCLRAAFPGGSMTGAPKPRTMEIIDSLETRPRGPYAGAIGYLAAGGGADLSIAIRTLTSSRDGSVIGAGGAITVRSDPASELRELLLKARAPLQAYGLAVHGRRDGAALASGSGRRRAALV